MGYYTPPSSGGGGGGFPSVVKAVNYTAQSDNLSFNLADDPATGDYVLNDVLTITTPDASTQLLMIVSWADENGAEDIGLALTSASPAGAFNCAMGELNLTLSPLTVPQNLHAVTGTPIAVAITVTPSAVGTAAPTSGNAGLLYAGGDTFTIDTGDGTATGQVLTVGAGGAVETVEITNGGATYTVSEGNATTATSGSGTGLELDILTLSTALQYTYHATLVRNQ